jgi:hypothetical protein
VARVSDLLLWTWMYALMRCMMLVLQQLISWIDISQKASMNNCREHPFSKSL